MGGAYNRRMLLAADIGNTNVTIGAFDGGVLAATWRLSTDSRRLADEYALLLREILPMKGVAVEDVADAAICSVVPPLTGVFEEVCRTLFPCEPLIVGAGTKTGVRVLYQSPQDVGADRVVNAAAALHRYGGPVIVADFGTATVFDAVTADGAYLGGAISIGVGLAGDALAANTAMLRRVDLAAPERAIGKNTADSIASGLVFGFAGLVESMTQRFRDEMDAPDAKVVGTGGLVSLIAEQTDVFDAVDPDLTLRGLRRVFDLNRDPALAGGAR